MLEIHEVTPETLSSVRHSVLRPNQPVEATIIPQDCDKAAVHWGAYEDGRIVGSATLLKIPPSEFPEHTSAWKLRGMATLPEVRGKRYGVQLLERCLEHARSQSGTLVWCNARVPAIGFYEKFGFQAIGEVYVHPELGPHQRMFLKLS